MKNKVACKKKWSIMYCDLKKIQEYMLGTRYNEFLEHVYSRKSGNVEFTLVVQHKHLWNGWHIHKHLTYISIVAFYEFHGCQCQYTYITPPSKELKVVTTNG